MLTRREGVKEHISGPSPGARRPEHYSPHPPGPDPPGPRAPGPAGPGAQGKLNLQPGPGPGPRPRPRWNGSFKGAGGVAGWYSWISLVSYPVDTRVNHTRDRSLTVAIYGYSPLPPGPEDWQDIHRPSLRTARAAMAVKQKNNNTTADGNPQETKVGGSDVTVTHNSNEPLVTVAVQTTQVLAQQVTVVVKLLDGEDEKQNCNYTKGETPRSPPKTNPWNEFQKLYKGTKFTIQEKSALHHQNKKKQHASLTTDGS